MAQERTETDAVTPKTSRTPKTPRTPKASRPKKAVRKKSTTAKKTTRKKTTRVAPAASKKPPVEAEEAAQPVEAVAPVPDAAPAPAPAPVSAAATVATDAPNSTVAEAAESPAVKTAPKRTRRGKRGGAKRKKATQRDPDAATDSKASEGREAPDVQDAAQPEAPTPTPTPVPVAPAPSHAPAASETLPETETPPVGKAPFGVGLVPNEAPDASAEPRPDARGGKAKRSRRGGARAQRSKHKRSTDHDSTAPEETDSEPSDTPQTDGDVVQSDNAVPADSSESTDAGAEKSEHADKGAGRPVLKQRPPRRARGGRGRRRSKKTNTESAADPTDSPVDSLADSSTETPAATPSEEDSRTAETEHRRSPTRRSRKRRTKTTPQEAESTEQSSPSPSPSPSPSLSAIDARTPQYSGKSDGREMIINITAGAECRIAILQDGRLEELYIERQSAVSHVGNIYVGKITNVEPSIQAAFVDFGLSRNGFLHISDVQPQYFPNNKNEREQVGKKVPRRDRPPIQKCFRRGDKVIVQVIKEGVGTKGPTLTSYLSIPGRFVVMMPGMEKLGVSRKIEDDTARRAMRELLGQLTLPDGMGFILRTAGLDRPKRELQSDLNYLNRLWKAVEKRIANQTPPCELYQESDLVIRTIRDVYATDFKRIVVDDPAAAEKAREFLRIAMPRTPGNVVAYERPEPIFHYFGVEEAIRRIHSRYVPLPSGGSIVIDSTEAMVAIDVNSGKFRELKDAEETAYRINIEAAEEIARQLRLRDLGGLVVCDFIDMRMDRHKRDVEKALRDALKKHKERARILRMSKFGLIEMTRQRQRQSIKRSIFVDCPHCTGSGLVKTPESMSLEVLRILQLLTHRRDVHRIEVTVATDVAELILNVHRAHLHDLETTSGKTIAIKPAATFAHDQVTCQCTDDRGMPLRIEV